MPGWISNCRGAVDDARQILTAAMPGRYNALFETIDARAPNADVEIGGYPRLFNGEDCNFATFFSRSEMSNLNGATDDLDALINARSTAYGFEFVDPRPAFTGHAVCAGEEWVNGLSLPIIESYHPNRAGNRAYAQAFLPEAATRSWPGAEPLEPSETPAAPGVSDIRTQVRMVAAMNLASPENLRRAETAGINPKQIQRLDEQLHSADEQKIGKALKKLDRLDRRYEARPQRKG